MSLSSDCAARESYERCSDSRLANGEIKDRFLSKEAWNASQPRCNDEKRLPPLAPGFGSLRIICRLRPCSFLLFGGADILLQVSGL
jgi:hypothetical protein